MCAEPTRKTARDSVFSRACFPVRSRLSDCPADTAFSLSGIAHPARDDVQMDVRDCLPGCSAVIHTYRVGVGVGLLEALDLLFGYSPEV